MTITYSSHAGDLARHEAERDKNRSLQESWTMECGRAFIAGDIRSAEAAAEQARGFMDRADTLTKSVNQMVRAGRLANG